MEIHFKVIGILLMGLALLHGVFPRYFKWHQALQSLDLLHRQMMKVHTLFIALVVFLMGLLCFTSASDLLYTDLGKKLCLGLGIFWSLRLFIQFFGYSSKLWKGKIFETGVHILFSMLWTYLSFIFLWAYFG